MHQQSFDLDSPGGRRDAILATIGDKAMSLVDICHELNLDTQSERARMRTALDHLERKNIVEIALHSDGRPLASNKSIVFRVSGRAPPEQAALLPAPKGGSLPGDGAASGSPPAPYVRPRQSVTASMKKGLALTTLLGRIVPGMTGWESVAQVAARTRLRLSVVREAISAGLHDNPAILHGWTPCGGHRTQRLGNRTLYLPASLADFVAEPETTPVLGRDPRVDVLASGSVRWENIEQIAARTGMSKAIVAEVLRRDSKAPAPTFASSSRTNGAGIGRPFRTASRYVVADRADFAGPPMRSTKRTRRTTKKKRRAKRRSRAT